MNEISNVDFVIAGSARNSTRRAVRGRVSILLLTEASTIDIKERDVDPKKISENCKTVECAISCRGD